MLRDKQWHCINQRASNSLACSCLYTSQYYIYTHKPVLYIYTSQSYIYIQASPIYLSQRIKARSVKPVLYLLALRSVRLLFLPLLLKYGNYIGKPEVSTSHFKSQRELPQINSEGKGGRVVNGEGKLKAKFRGTYAKINPKRKGDE